MIEFIIKVKIEVAYSDYSAHRKLKNYMKMLKTRLHLYIRKAVPNALKLGVCLLLLLGLSQCTTSTISIIDNDFMKVTYHKKYKTTEGGWKRGAKDITPDEYKAIFLGLIDKYKELKAQGWAVEGELMTGRWRLNRQLPFDELNKWYVKNINEQNSFPVKRLALVTQNPKYSKSGIDAYVKRTRDKHKRLFNVESKFVMKVFHRDYKAAQKWVRGR
ncbi:MAG TPA: hypothetical protein DCS93_00670 [Microscillaceae bacterium]|nr:hypothetical protein [Microscillaceae bacterium]